MPCWAKGEAGASLCRQAGGWHCCPPGRSSSSTPPLPRVVAPEERSHQLGSAGAIRWMEPCLQSGEAAVLQTCSSPPKGIVSERSLYLLWRPVKNPALWVAPETSFAHRSLVHQKSASKVPRYATDLLHNLWDFIPSSPALACFLYQWG